MPKLLRKGAGQPIREAMQNRGMSGPELSEATKRLDVTGKGISPATVGKLAGKGRTAKDSCEFRTAWLIAEALDARIHRLFAMPSVSTDTVERSTPNG